MSETPDKWKPTHEQEAFKNAFGRAIILVGSNRRMAELLGISEGQVSRWKHLHHNEHVPAGLHSKVDAAAGYPCMLETSAALCGYSIRREDVTSCDLSLIQLAGLVAEDSGRAVRTVLDAKSDMIITGREMNLIEAEAKTAVSNINRMVEAARAKHESGQIGTVVRMTGEAR
ncbi:helix-turn-helix domain-containing protein [Aureimonas fodinaquatilis]|uniref:Helix-turn-helix domain-containing protein n=1 Tax=Aureimonas fodinaquatilis TaxID=2565783 RepID=A0A5B0DWG1_9HYPH|nr:helix-turn-helix domain-containing protein [Aureimonas fodinaquatilis]KAA0970836.1 helix-turn-helix domain-containing protein [Aureimonas fodinaquatilis]